MSYNRLLKKNVDYFKLFIWVMGGVLVLYAAISFMFAGKHNAKPRKYLEELKNTEEEVTELPLDLKSNLNLAKTYYYFAREDDIYYNYFMYNDIPSKFYQKTIIKWSILEYDVKSLQNSFKNNDPKLRDKFLKRIRYISDDLYEKALICYRKILALAPEIVTPKDMYCIGLIYLKKDESYIQYAIEFFERALKHGFVNKEIYSSLGNAYYINREIEKAKLYYRKAYEMDRNSLVVSYNYAWILWNKGEYEPAKKIAVASIKNIESRMAGKKKYEKYEQNLVDGLIPVFNKNRLGLFYFLLSRIYESDKDFDMTIKNLRKSEKYLPYSMEIYLKFGKILFHLNRYEEALIKFRKVISIQSYNQYALEKIEEIKKKLNNNKLSANVTSRFNKSGKNFKKEI